MTATNASTEPATMTGSPTTTQVIDHVLQRAAFAHHFHELELGGPHAEWPPWYAAHMAQTLADHGYRLVLANGRDGIDITTDPKAGVAEEAEAKKLTH